MNTPKTYNFSDFYKGDGVKSFRILCYADEEHTVPVNLTGCTALMQLKNGGKVVFTYSTESTLTATSAPIVITNNEIRFTEILKWRIPAFNYAYDLQITYPDGFVRTFIKGQIPMEQDVSDNG